MDPGALVGIAVGLVGALVALVVTVLSIVLTIAAVAIPLWLVFKVLGQRAANERKLLAEGVPAPAKVVSIAETGMIVNHQPMLRIVLEVAPPGGAPFTAAVDRITSVVEIPRLQPGALVEVRYERDKPQNLMIARL